MDNAGKIKKRKNLKRLFDDIPFETIEKAEDNKNFQAGKKAAKNGEARDESKGLDWILGYDSVKEGQQ